MSGTPSYVRLFNMLSAIREMSPLNLLSADEEILLDSLIVHWHEHGEITVSELMRDERFGSQATVYRRVIGLKEKGMVALRTDPRDRRVKFVEATDSTRAYIDHIDLCISALLPAR